MNSPNAPLITNDELGNELTLVDVLDVVLGNRLLIVGITAVALFFGVMYAFLATPVYQTDIMVQVEDSEAGAAAKSILSDVSSLFNEKSSAAAEMQIIGSRLVLQRTVENLRLYLRVEPKRFPIFGEWMSVHLGQNMHHALASLGGGYAWQNEKLKVDLFNVPATLLQKKFSVTVIDKSKYKVDAPDLSHSFEGEIGRLETFQSEYGPIQILIKDFHAESGVAFSVTRFSERKIVENLQENLNIQEKVKQSDVVIASLQGTDPTAISETMNEIGRQYIRQNVDRKSAEAAQSLEFLNIQLPKLKLNLDNAEARYTAMRNRSGTIDITEEAKLTLDKLADAREKVLQLTQQRQELAVRFNSAHPAIKALDGQIAALGAYESTFERELKKMPDIQQQAVRLQLDVQVNRDLYMGLLNNAQQLQLVKAGKVGNVRLVDTAVVPETPIKPKKGVIIGISIALGLMLGLALAFLRNKLFHGVTEPAEIERHTGLNVYATVPLSVHQRQLNLHITARSKRLNVLATDAPTDPAIESLRSFRTALQFAMLGVEKNILLLTGPAPGVGKSFISANFSAVLASGGKRILLIDGDMRKGHLHQYFGCGRGLGFSDIISGRSEFVDVVHKNIIDGLDVLTTGTLPPNPAELLLNERVEQMLKSFSTQYDLVVIDSPPILAAADTTILAPNAGAVFLVAMFGRTKAGELVECAKRLNQIGVTATGVLLNGFDRAAGRYGYAASYGSYRYQAYTYTPDGKA